MFGKKRSSSYAGNEGHVASPLNHQKLESFFHENEEIFQYYAKTVGQLGLTFVSLGQQDFTSGLTLLTKIIIIG